MFKTLLISGIASFFVLMISIEDALPAKRLYDDFSSGYLSGEKWRQREYVREIVDGKFVCKLGNRSPGMGAEVAPGVFHNNLDFHNDYSGSAHTIQSEITIVEARLDDAADARSFARIGGYFYNVNPTGGATGDIFAMLMLGNKGSGVEAFWEVQRMDSDDTRTWTVIGEGTVPVSESLDYGVPYIAKLIYTPADPPAIPNPTFTFSINGQDADFEGPPYVREAQTDYKTIGTGINATGGSNTGFIFAKFDDVYLNNSSSTFDTFSLDSLDPINWKTIDWVRECSEGYLRANTRNYDSGRYTVTYFDKEKDTPYLEVKVRIESDSQLSPGASGIARIGGYYYNESRGPGSGNDYNDYEGDVFAQIRLRYYSDGNTEAQAWVGRSNDANESSFTDLFWHSFSTPITLDTYYRLSIKYENGQIIFRCDNEQVVFNIETEAYPPYGIHRQIRTQLYADSGESGYIKASYDDVYVADSPIIDAITALKIASSIPLGENEFLPTDFNLDNKIDTADALAAIQIAADIRYIFEHSSMRYALQVYHPDNYGIGVYSIEPFTLEDVTGPNVDQIWQNEGTHALVGLLNRPNVGDIYNFSINYPTGPNREDLFKLTKINENFAFIASPPNGNIITTTTPTFTWSEASNIESYSLIVQKISDPDKVTVWYINLPAGTTSILYNSDGRALEPLYSNQSYEIVLHTFGTHWNQASTVSTFSIQIP